MSGDNPKDHHASESSTPQNTPGVPAVTSQPVESLVSPDRAELLSRARTFLASPQVQFQDSDAKRAFLVDKGLTPSEVDKLLRELVRSELPVPVHAHSSHSLHLYHHVLILHHLLPIFQISSLVSPESSLG